jgi:hypothetical protein
MTKAEALKHDRVRELILQSLSTSYPAPVDSVVLRRHLGNFGHPITDEDLTSYIAYLEEKELVRSVKRGAGIVLVRITAKGLDVLDGRIEEFGVGRIDENGVGLD